MKEKSLEELLEHEDRPSVVGKAWAAAGSYIHKAEQWINPRPLLGGIATAAVLGGINSFSPHLFPVSTNYLASCFVFGFVNTYFNGHLSYDDDVPKGSIRSGLEWLWHHPVLPALGVAGWMMYEGNSHNAARFSHMLSNPDHWLSISRYLIPAYLYTSACPKLLRYIGKVLGKDFWDDQISRVLQMRVLSTLRNKPPETARHLIEISIPYLERSMLLNYTHAKATRLFYSYLSLDRVGNAFRMLESLIENKTPAKGIVQKSDMLSVRTDWGDFKNVYRGRYPELADSIEGMINAITSDNITLEGPLSSLIEKDPGNWAPYALRGAYHRGQGHSEEARTDFAALAKIVLRDYPGLEGAVALGTSRRSTYVLSDPILESLLVLQKTTPEKAALAQAVSGIFGNRVGLVLDYLPAEQLLIQRRELCQGGINFYEALPMLTRHEKFKATWKAAEFLHDYQTTSLEEFEARGVIMKDMSVENPDFYGERQSSIFVKHLTESGILSPLKDRVILDTILEDGYILGREAATLPKSSYWDTNPRNILQLYTLSQDYVDFEIPEVRLRGIDWINLTEFCSWNFNPTEQARILHRWFPHSQQSTWHDVSREVHWAGVIRHPEVVGYSIHNEMNAQTEEQRLDTMGLQLFHLERASHYASRTFSLGYWNQKETATSLLRYAANLERLSARFSVAHENDLARLAELRACQAEEYRKLHSICSIVQTTDPEVRTAILHMGAIYGVVGAAAYGFFFRLVPSLIK